MQATPTLMRALRVDEANGAFNPVDLPVPTPGPGEVLVRVHASGVNPLDTKIRAGQAGHARQPLPAVLGIDMAGVIAAVGTGVTGWQVGDAVYAMAGGIGGLQGSLADYMAVDARLLAAKPARLSMREAAALPLAAITAWEGLVDRAAVRPGQTVLVQGGAGGVGHIAVQLAQALGARVFATAGVTDFDAIRAWGATPIDRHQPLDAAVAEHTAGQGFDVVFDAVGGAVLDASFTAARRHGGHVVSILGWGTHSLAPLSFRAATYSGVFTLLPLLTGEGRERHGHILRETAALVNAGAITPRLDAGRFTLATAGDAHARVAAGAARGKVVVDVAA